jgi:hypothetical protein
MGGGFWGLSGFSIASAAIVGGPSAVMSRHKDCRNGKEVIGKLPCIVLGTVWRTVNHEFCANFCKNGVQEVGLKATQSVSVHDHNLFDQSVDNGVQNGFMSL